MDQQGQARRSLAESFRRERAEIEAKERANPPRKRPRWLQWVQDHTAWVVALVALLVVALPFTLVALHLADGVGISGTVKHFCTAAAKQDYSSAYADLSRGAQQRLGRDAFISSASALLDTCDLAENAAYANIQGDTAHLRLRFYLKGGGGDTDPEQDATVTLVRQDGSWRLDTSDDSALPFLPAASA